jgi:hypothetical protein
VLKPHLRRCWCIPPEQDAAFVAAMEDVLDLYCQPYDPRRPVVCMDEQPRQLVKEIRRPVPPGPGRPARLDHEYERGGTANLFLMSEPLAGWRHVEVSERRTRLDWAHQIRGLLDGRYREAERIRMVLDNLNTHSIASLYEAFGPAEARRLAKRLELHHTPKHGSWLNVAEVELSALTQQCLSRRIPDMEALRRQTGTWTQQRNAKQKGVDWQFTTADARTRLKRLYPDIQP